MDEHRELIIESVNLGDPASKSRARFNGRGSVVRTYTPEKTKAAEEAWQWILRAGFPEYTKADAEYDYRLELKFYTATWQRRDLDNMIKLVGDACNGIVYADDSQVTAIEAYVTRADERPRTELRIYRLTPQRSPRTLCKVCQKPVAQYPSKPSRFCSKECAGKSQQKRVLVACDGCGKEVERAVWWASKPGPKYCGSACKYRNQKGGGRPRLPPVNEEVDSLRADHRRWKSTARDRLSVQQSGSTLTNN